VNTPKVSLTIVDAEGNSTQMPLSFETLASAISASEDTLENSKYYELLAIHPASIVREAIARKSFLNEKTVSILSSDKSVNVLRLLAWSNAYKKYAKEKDIEYAIDCDNEVASTIAIDMGQFKKVNKQTILKKLLSCEDPTIIAAVAGSSDSPKKIFAKLKKNSDGAIRFAASTRLPD